MLQKQNLNVNFSSGLDTKTDPFQVQPGKFASLKNSIFDKAGRLTKRNGYGPLASLPDATSRYLTTFNGGLTAVGSTVQALSDSVNKWYNKGKFQSIDVNTLPLVRSNTYQGQSDAVVSSNGLVCTAYTDYVPSGGSPVAQYKYVISDVATGQNIIPPTALAGADTTYGTPRVFLLDTYFIIVYTTHPSSYHLVYIAISTQDPSSVTSPIDISSSYAPSTTLAFDGIVTNNRLYVAYNTTSGGQAIKITYLTPVLGSPVNPTTFSGSIGTLFTFTADETNSQNPILYLSFYDSGSQNGYTAVLDKNINVITAPTLIISSMGIANLASVAKNGVGEIFYEVPQTYSYNAVGTHYIKYSTVSQSGTVVAGPTVIRSVGLASKAILYNGIVYFLAIYDSSYQPTYFLLNIDIATSSTCNIVSKLAYSNGGAYYTLGLPAITLLDNKAYISYLFKDLIQAVNKGQGVANSAGVYSQLGINLVTFNFIPNAIITSEIGGNLNMSGGFITAYDGFSLVEQGFHVYPDNVQSSPSGSGGSMTDQQYFYLVTYEWADNQGNVFRSAPSLPIGANITGGSGSAGSVVLHIPTLRLTSKTLNPVKIVIYRWSTAQQNYYQVTSILNPILNDMTTDQIAYTDTQSDTSILGNSLVYTTGGVIENIGPPAASIMTLFNNRLWLLDSEDRNLLWYSKQVIEATPVEMSDLLTIFVSPNTASEGSTGPITAIGPMDDKLIIFKENALGYISGVGPDNTGANNGYSDFTLINSVVGCTVQSSIVFTPSGLMFQSNKGIWLLGRDLSTQYIGAPVEDYTKTAKVLSAENIPATNQVRFTLDSGITLMYDYFYGQWGTFTNVPAISSTIYQDLHTYVDSFGRVFQETPGAYLDNTSPVLMSFTTGWLNLAGLQGYERFYQLFLLGQYLSPFKLNVQLAYDYNSSISQATVAKPKTPSSAYGGDQLWGSGYPWGGPSNVFEARIFPTIQKCEAFQITIDELFDNSLGIAAGAGLTISGMNLLVGIKKISRTSSASRSFG